MLKASDTIKFYFIFALVIILLELMFTIRISISDNPSYEIIYDDPPPGFSLKGVILPVSKPAVHTQSTCDGDGVSGYRVQVLYVRTTDTPSRFVEYLDSFRTWAAETDAVFAASAQETGGQRGVRYVQDPLCNPVVEEVVLPSGSLNDFTSMIAALSSLGFDRVDRKYLDFVEGNAWCGIADWSSDDRPDVIVNRNNQGPSYTYISNSCWSQTVAAHELMHTLGGVQVTAPHSSQETHCFDMDDLMCRPTNGWPTQQVCAWAGYLHFDCNHDDYYSTEPIAGSYLATHWNAANNRFLIGSPQPLPTPCYRGNSGKLCK